MTRRATLRLACAAAAVSVVVAGVSAAPRRPAGFPHTAHERLFPVCESCHAGVVRDDPAATYPVRSDCIRCHDGTRAVEIDWREPDRAPSNLRFSHARHRERAAAAGVEPAPTCASCHGTGAAGRMAVDRAAPERCISCHTHRADTHLAAAVECARCHRPLVEARDIGLPRVAGFPRPASHGDADFAEAHGRAGSPAAESCAVCHARETCERCHANADRVPRIAALAHDARVAALEADRTATYPVPASHARDDWYDVHGRTARAAADGCANCHTRPSCTRCHSVASGSAGRSIESLPAAVPGRAPGVDPERITRTVHAPDFVTRHGRHAASGRMDCAQCHAREQCAACHAGTESRAFHAPNFVERHAVDVFANRSECGTCHRTETFCRGCHARTGVAARDMKAAFHDGQPMWALSHGRAARLGLEACASCHRQNDCVQCHSAAGGWGVSPHGPGFTGRGASRSSASCRLCHLSNPARSSP